ncbi:MAG: mechanosensitive ion channel [Myxococcales bacterium]|nr:mechanosensitive ion channel [Myxococcales bacterium]
MTLDELTSNAYARQGGALLVAVVVVVVVTRLLRAGAARAIDDKDTRYRVRKLIGALGYLAVAIAGLSILSGDFGRVTVVLGALSVGIGFALQEVIASVAGWLALSFGRFYGPGDRIQLGGILGDVIDIGILRTTVMECGGWVKGDLYSGRIVRVANSFVFKEPVFNYSGEFPFLWDELTVPIKYGSDHRAARAILERVAAEVVGAYAATAKVSWAELVRRYRIEDAKLEPMVTIVANDNWIEFTVRYAVDYKARRITKDRLFTRILDEIDATGGAVALASATFELVGAPPVTVQLDDRRTPPPPR